jgi:hypothetical protein
MAQNTVRQNTIQVDHPVFIGQSGVVRTEVVVRAVDSGINTSQGSYIKTAYQTGQPMLDHQAMLQVTNLQEGYDEQGAYDENSGQRSGESEESEAGVPYAILLALVALIGLVPVARRNGGL